MISNNMLGENYIPCLLGKDVFQHSTRLPLESVNADMIQRVETILPHSFKVSSTKRKNEFIAGRFCAVQALKKAGGK